MEVTFIDTERSTSTSELDALERRLNILLPDEYRQHLLKYNGGHPRPYCFDFFENSGRPNSTIIGWFLTKIRCQPPLP